VRYGKGDFNYLKLLSMIILQIDGTQWFSLIVIILAVLGFVIKIAKGSQEKSELKEIINKLAEEFPNLPSFLNQQNSFAFIARSLNEAKNIPEIITIRYLTILTEETITTGILPDIQSSDKENLHKRISLLKNVSKKFKSSMSDKAKALSELNERKNVFYISKQVIAEIENPNGGILSHKGLLILGLHYLMFFPTNELEDYVDFEKIEKLLDKITEEIPLLNFGVSSATLLKNINEDTKEEKSMFSEKLKEQMLKLMYENKGFVIEYFDIEKVYYAGTAKRILGAAKFSFFLNNSFVYNFWKLKDNLDLIDILFEKTISLALMNGNMILSRDFNDEHNFTSFYKVPEK
jgi:hypothetical protein